MTAFKLLEDIPTNDGVIIKMGVILMSKITNNIQAIGEYLTVSGSDDLTDGGFWLYDYNTLEMYYSNKFKLSLGEDLKPNYASFARYANIEDLANGHKMVSKLIENNSELFFSNQVRYKNDSENINFTVNCTGAVFYLFGKPKIVLGTHKFI